MKGRVRETDRVGKSGDNQGHRGSKSLRRKTKFLTDWTNHLDDLPLWERKNRLLDSRCSEYTIQRGTRYNRMLLDNGIDYPTYPPT